MGATDIHQQFSINGFRPEDEADILAMNLAEYGPRDGLVTSEAFHWRFAENPSGPAEITAARLTSSGKLVGFTWTVPMRMRLFGKNHLAAMTANQLIHPEYRQTMVYARMARHRLKWLQQQGIPFRYNFPTEAIHDSAGSAEKMSSFLIPLLVRPLDPRSLANRRFKQRWLSMLVGWSGKPFVPALFASLPLTGLPDALKIEQPDHFDKRFDTFWERVQDKYAVMTVRDRAFLTWRFAPVAGRAYRILAAIAGDELVGYTVLRITDEIQGIPAGLVMDLLLEPGQRGETAGRLLMAEAWRCFKREKVWLAGGLAFSHTAEYAALRNAGYRSLPSRWVSRPFRVAFNCFGADLPPTSQVEEHDMFFTIADYEAH